MQAILPEDPMDNIMDDLDKKYYSYGLDAQLKGEYDTAIQYYRTALTMTPNNIDIYYNLGVIFKKKEEYEKAIEIYKKAITIDPENPDLYFSLGQCYEKVDQSKESILNYQKAISHYPAFAEAYFALGKLYIHEENKKMAISSFANAVKISGGYYDIIDQFGLRKEVENYIETTKDLHEGFQSTKNKGINPFE